MNSEQLSVIRNDWFRLLTLGLGIFMAVIGIWGTAYGQAIKVGEEIVLKAPGDPGGSRRGNSAIAFGPTSSKDSVAAGKGIFLAAWQEGWNGDGGSSRIYALRVGLDGKPLDAKPVEIAPCKTGVQEKPRVAFFGENFLVVWQDLRNGRDLDVLGVRVSADGKVLDKQPIAIAATPRSQAMPDVAADDKGFMVAWHGFPDDDFQAKLYIRRIGTDGTLGETKLLTVGATPRIAWNGKEYLVLYFKACNPWGAVEILSYINRLRMDTAGKILPSKRGGGRLKVGAQHSVCGLPKGEGWIIVTHGGIFNYWGRGGAAGQHVGLVTPEGQMDLPPKIKKPTPKKNVPENCLDTSLGKKSHTAVSQAYPPDIWPYGRSAVVPDGKYCITVWQRFHLGDLTGLALINGDIRVSRVHGWKVVDKDGGVAVAESKAEELDPALAGNNAGKLLCVYEKRGNGKSLICARTIETQKQQGDFEDE
jgi:hypothetical protein